MPRSAPAGPARAVSPALASAIDRLGELVDAFEQHPDPQVRHRAVELLRCVDAVHRPGLRDVAALLHCDPRPEGAQESPDLQLLLELYDLDAGGERARADAVLDRVRPYIESHGGRLEVVEAAAGVVQVRLTGSCAGCPASSMTLRHVVEEALRSELTGFVRLEVLEAAPSPVGVLPLTVVGAKQRRSLSWHPVLRAGDISEGALRTVDVDGFDVLFLGLTGELYAYRNACPPSHLPLSGARIDGETLVCPWHGCRFDGRSGRRLERDGPDLELVPVAIEADEVRVGLLSETAA